VNINILDNLRKNINFGDILLKNFINLNEYEAEMVRNWRNDNSIREWCYQEHIISSEEQKKFLKDLEEDNHNYYWLIKKKNECIGVISLNRLDLENGNAYIGVYSQPKMKGKGNILMNCLKKIAFDIFKLHSLKLEVIEDNKNALSFYKRSGFKKEGKLKDFVFKHGKYKNVIVMGLIKNEN